MKSNFAVEQYLNNFNKKSTITDSKSTGNENHFQYGVQQGSKILSGLISSHNRELKVKSFCKILLATRLYNSKVFGIKYLSLMFKKKVSKLQQAVLLGFKGNAEDSKRKGRKVVQLGRLVKQIIKRRIQTVFMILLHNKKQKVINDLDEVKSDTSSRKQFIRSTSSKNIPAVGQEQSINLSEEVKEALKKMQRFDRFVYTQNSQKLLTEPVEKQLRRIERLKNGKKDMRDIYFDNELTITCLFNHVKLIGQLNRQLNNFANIKLQKQQVENKIIQTNVQMKKQAKQRQLKNKQMSKFLQIIISGLQDPLPEKGRRLVESHIRNLDGDKKVLGNLVASLLTKISQRIPSQKNVEVTCQQVYFTHLNKLNDDIGQIEKKILTLQKQKMSFDQKIGESKIDRMRQTYETLSHTWSCILSLHKQIKQKTNNNDQSKLNEKRVATTKQINSENTKQSLLTAADFESICHKIVKGQQWIGQLEVMKTKYNRRSALTKTDSSQNLFILINQLIKTTKDVRTLRDIVMTKQQKLKQFQQGSKIQKTLSRIKSVDKIQKLDPLKVEIIQMNKLCDNITSILDKRQSQNKSQMVKLKRMLDNKKKYNQLVPLIFVCERLSQIILNYEDDEKKKTLQDNRYQQILTKELNLLANMFEKFDMMIEIEKIETGNIQCLNKAKKNLEQVDLKIGKILQNNLIGEQWQKILSCVISSTNKLFTSVDLVKSNSTTPQTPPPPTSPRNNNAFLKQQSSLKQQNEQLRKSLKQLQSKLYKSQLQIQKLHQKSQITNNDAQQRRKSKTQITKLNKIIQEHLKKIRQNQQQLKMAYDQIQSLKATQYPDIGSQKQIQTMKSQIKKKQQQIKQSARDIKKKQDQFNRNLKQKQSLLKNEILKNEKLQASMADLIQSMKNDKQDRISSTTQSDQTKLLQQLTRLKQQINVLNNKVGNNKQSNEILLNQLSLKTQQQNLQLKQKVSGLIGQIKQIQKVSTKVIQQVPITNVINVPKYESNINSRTIIYPELQNQKIKQLESKLNLQKQQNVSYLETIQRLSQKIHERQVDNNQILKNHYQQLFDIAESCQQCAQCISENNGENNQVVGPVYEILQNIIVQIRKYTSQHENDSRKSEPQRIDKIPEFKKISQIVYKEPENMYVDEIQYFGNPSLSYLTMQEQNKLMSRIEFLQKQRQYLYKRIKILSVFVSIDEPQKAFIHNLNCVIDRVFSFLLQSRDFKNLRIDYNYFMSFVEEISANVSEENFINYFRAVEDFFKQLLQHVYIQKLPVQINYNHSEKGYVRGSTIKSDFTQQYPGRYDLSMHSEVRSKRSYKPSVLQNLLNEYLSSRNVKVLSKIEQVLSSPTNVDPIK